MKETTLQADMSVLTNLFSPRGTLVNNNVQFPRVVALDANKPAFNLSTLLQDYEQPMSECIYFKSRREVRLKPCRAFCSSISG